MSDTAQHHAPVWGPKADFIIKADLGTLGDMPGRFEQFWARRLAADKFEICCIPFFTRGIALADHVDVEPGGRYLIRSVIQRSGHGTIRVAVADGRRQGELHPILHDWAEGTGMLYEFYAPGYLAVDLPPECAEIPPVLEELADSGAIEWELDQWED